MIVSSLILVLFIFLSILIKPAIEGFTNSEYEGANGKDNSDTQMVSIDKECEKICYPPILHPEKESCKVGESNVSRTYVYYPRYKPWWRYVKDLKTRPEYNRVIFPPYGNVYYNPNITSSEYYQRVASDNIMPQGRDADIIKRTLDRNFQLRNKI